MSYLWKRISPKKPDAICEKYSRNLSRRQHKFLRLEQGIIGDDNDITYDFIFRILH